jgi:glucose/arabinose dehydrogenase
VWEFASARGFTIVTKDGDARDGTLFMSTGGGGDGAQNPATHGGKVLRLKDEGSVPPDNPFVGRPNHAPEVYSLGHRNSLGLAPRRRRGRASPRLPRTPTRAS